jgi:hypothetical protein
MLKDAVGASRLLCFFASLWPALAAAQPAPVGPVFQVNTFTAADQVAPFLAVSPAGNFVVIWTSASYSNPPKPTQDGDGAGVYGQLFHGSGTPIGPEFRVNETTVGNQDSPAVGMDSAGNFVVVWRDEGPPPEYRTKVKGRRYDRSGGPLGGEFLVSADDTARDYSPSIAVLPHVGFLVAWESYESVQALAAEILARRFDASGAPIGPEFQVDTPSRRQPGNPSVAARPTGEFIVAWESYREDASGRGDILGRRFTAAGDPVENEKKVNEPDFFRAFTPEVDDRPDGGYVVVWEDFGIFGRRYAPSGEPEGPAFQISADRIEDFYLPKVSVDGTGGFIVVWYKFGSTFEGVFGRRYDRTGVPQGAEFRLDGGTAPSGGASVASLANGDFIVAWTSGVQSGTGPDGDGLGVFARRFRLPPLGADVCLAEGGHLACDTLRDGGEAEIEIVLAAQPGEVPLVGNLDGDSRDDSCLFRAGRFLCDTAHDGGATDVEIAFGRAGDVPLLGDVNGDGRDDACLRRKRRFTCDTAHNGRTGEVVILFGRLSDTALLGDVDGDGDDDLCLYRGNQFLCDTVHDGGHAEVVVAFGMDGDIPLLGDVDDDGDDDFCVFRGDRFLCDVEHDGGHAEFEIPFSGSGGIPLLGNVDGF